MGRELLRRAGFDPDEVLEPTADLECGAAILRFKLEYGCLPTDEDIDRIAEIANFNLVHGGLPSEATEATVRHALAVIQAEELN